MGFGTATGTGGISGSGTASGSLSAADTAGGTDGTAVASGSGRALSITCSSSLTGANAPTLLLDATGSLANRNATPMEAELGN